jgi:Putative adhesin
VASTLTQDRTTGPERGPGGPGVRRAWRIVGSLAVVAVLVFGVYQVVIALAHEEYTFERTFEADDITTIEVDNGASGPIRIMGSDTDTISVTGHVDDGLRRTGHTERVEGDRLVLDSSCPLFGSSFCEVAYSIEVPRGLDVVAEGSNSRIIVTDVDGDVDARSDHGRVELARIGGAIRADNDNGSVALTELTGDEVEATTDNGSVRVQFDRAPSRVIVDSDNGDVEVVVPEGDAYQVRPDTDNGALVTGEIATDPSSERLIEATTDNGDVIVRHG